MASQNVVEAVAELGSNAYRELAELRERVQQLEAAEEGAREAFEHVVQQNQNAQAEVNRLHGLLQAAYGDIRRLTADPSSGWTMPRRKRETLQRRHDYLRSIPHDERNQFMEAEISALDWVLHRVSA